MFNCPKMLLIGASARKLGKTELVCSLIFDLVSQAEITALKICTLRPGEEEAHPADEVFLDFMRSSKPYLIIKEKDTSATLHKADTARMLQSGAKEAFLILTKYSYLEEAFQEVLKNTPADHLIVCESTSLRQFVTPGFFIMLDDFSGEKTRKPSAWDILSLADKIVDIKTMDYGSVLTEVKKWLEFSIL